MLSVLVSVVLTRRANETRIASKFAYDIHANVRPFGLKLLSRNLPYKFQLFQESYFQNYVHGRLENREAVPLRMCQHFLPHRIEQSVSFLRSLPGHC